MDERRATDTQPVFAACVRGGGTSRKFRSRQRRASPDAVRRQPSGARFGAAFRTGIVRALEQAGQPDAGRRTAAGSALESLRHHQGDLCGTQSSHADTRPVRPLHSEHRRKVARTPASRFHCETSGSQHPAVIECRAPRLDAPRGNRCRDCVWDSAQWPWTGHAIPGA